MSTDRKKITINIDGRAFDTKDDDQEVGALLRLAGVDPALFDLAKVKKDGEYHEYKKDEKVIDLHDGEAFVTVRISAPVG